MVEAGILLWLLRCMQSVKVHYELNGKEQSTLILNLRVDDDLPKSDDEHVAVVHDGV
jgi:hypothetical protein